MCLQVGKAMSSNESAAYEIMRTLDVNYVLVIFGGVIGYSGDDINKFLWMVRIAEGEHPKDIKVYNILSCCTQLYRDATFLALTRIPAFFVLKRIFLAFSLKFVLCSSSILQLSILLKLSNLN